MTTMISYAREQAERVGQLKLDIESSGREVWLDRHIEGSQPWWDVILKQIELCDVFIVAASYEYFASAACRAELRYARALNRPILPVTIVALPVETFPDNLAAIQIVDLSSRTADSITSLNRALASIPPAPPLPMPRPAAPPLPGSALAKCEDQLESDLLQPDVQDELVARLRALLDQPETRLAARDLLGQLLRRQDLRADKREEVAELIESDKQRDWSMLRRLVAAVGQLGRTLFAGDQKAARRDPSVPGWYANPFGQGSRWFDGVRWTNAVAASATPRVDPPNPLAVAAAPAGWSAGEFTGLVIGTIFTAGILGLVMGLRNRTKPGRRRQATWLLLVAVAWGLYLAISAIVEAIMT